MICVVYYLLTATLVLGVKGLTVPIPSQPTKFTCTLNNGIHFVTTPECALAKDCKVDQVMLVSLRSR